MRAFIISALESYCISSFIKGLDSSPLSSSQPSLLPHDYEMVLRVSGAVRFLAPGAGKETHQPVPSHRSTRPPFECGAVRVTWSPLGQEPEAERVVFFHSGPQARRRSITPS